MKKLLVVFLLIGVCTVSLVAQISAIAPLKYKFINQTKTDTVVAVSLKAVVCDIAITKPISGLTLVIKSGADTVLSIANGTNTLPFNIPLNVAVSSGIIVITTNGNAMGATLSYRIRK